MNSSLTFANFFLDSKIFALFSIFYTTAGQLGAVQAAPRPTQAVPYKEQPSNSRADWPAALKV